MAYKAEKLKATYNRPKIFGEENKLIARNAFSFAYCEHGMGGHWSI